MHCNFRQTGSRSDDSVFVIITGYRTLLCLDVCVLLVSGYVSRGF